MNKMTSTLAGLALAATASIVPAFAQGNFTNLGVPFTFTDTGTTATVSNLAVTYNPIAGLAETGFLDLTLTGGTGSPTSGSNFFSGASLTFTSTGNPTITDSTFTNGAYVSFVPTGPAAGTANISSVGKSTNGNSFILNPGSPVPEASTVVSFGALLALGGLAVLRRKSVKA